MTRRNSLQTIHEPFGDAYYFGPERMGARFENDEKARLESGFSDSTFKTIMDRIDEESAEGKRVFIKDITYYIVPPEKQDAHLAPSLHSIKRGVGTDDNAANANGNAGHKTNGTVRDSGIVVGGIDSPPKSPPFPYATPAEPSNPTVIPRDILERFHYTFLIRHPKHAIPSWYRCCIPPLLERTGFNPFMPSEAGYDELRRLFDYCKDTGMVGPNVCGQNPDAEGTDDVSSPKEGNIEICVIDADDLLDDPEGILRKYCKSIGLDFRQEMLNWDNEEDHDFARATFEKWNGFHDDAINSKDLKPRQHKKKVKSDEELHKEWIEKFGKEAADMILQTVQDNVETYEYLKQYAIKTPTTVA